MTEDQVKEIFAKLVAPFPAEEIEWRAAVTNSEKTSGLALAYITARAVMDRLDEAVGPENWQNTFTAGPGGGVVCGLSLKIDGEWVTKWDGAENTEFEDIKGGLSSAFKRAGVQWGIGRYLYRLESKWEPCVAHGKVIEFRPTPKLPAWALPKAKTERKAEAGEQKAEKKAEKKAPEENTPEPKTSMDLATYALATYKMDGKAVGRVLRAHGVEEFHVANWDSYLTMLKDAQLSAPKAE